VNAAQTSGFLSLAGVALRTSATKADLRKPEWAYRFWRAGHDKTVRAVQVFHAMRRIDRIKSLIIQGRPLMDYVSSEYGMALVLDQHVNRPGHVVATLEAALTGLPVPSTWSNADEAAFLDRYLAKRASTTMTHSTERAEAIHTAVVSGDLSAGRGSFVG
jgi:hypothetical protein